MRFSILVLAGLLAAGPAAAASGPSVVLTLKDHRFSPSTITVPAGQAIHIELINRDAASEEFDSVDLGVEKDVTPNGRASFTVGPLKAGTYSFMGELHSDTASGTIEAVEAAGPTAPGR